MPKPRPQPPRAWERLLGVALLSLTAAATALALSPGIFSERIPFTDADLGGIAGGTIKAHRDYDIPDDSTTQRMREEAVAGVRAVYEHDTTLIDIIASRIRDGFAFARSMIEEAPTPAERLQILEPLREDLERRLGARLEDEELVALARVGFAQEVEDGVVALTAQVMREMVVSDREELAQHRSRGIAIRRLAGKSAAVEVLSDVEGIRDLATVRARLSPTAPELSGQAREVRNAAVQLARREIRSNLKYDPDLTAKRRDDAKATVKPVVIQLKKGEKIIGDGERIEKRHLVIFQGMRLQAEAGDGMLVRTGGALLSVLLLAGIFGAARSGFGAFRLRKRDIALLGLLGVATLLSAFAWNEVAAVLRERTPEVPPEAWTYAFPFAAGALVLRLVLGGEAAFLFAVGTAALVGVAAGSSLPTALVVLLGSLAAAQKAEDVRDRYGLFRAGAFAGVAQALVVICFGLLGSEPVSVEVVAGSVAAVLGGAILVPIVAMGLLALLELGFGYLSDLRLVELASLNHPALKELIVQAPGTYHHSIIVGTLVEGAAEAIGANPLLAKVCAYYHDLGKGRNPLFFGENQKGHNPHDELPPEESARIIIDHVDHGLEIARKHKLPRLVADAIPQHHGTRLVGFFYHKAVRAEEGREEGRVVDPEAFRYGGPKPQMREHALVMMADAAEAASRAMPEPTPERLRTLVRKLIQGIFLDGQLDECPLTLQDLSQIEDSFCATLEAIYHARPVYPPGAQAPAPDLGAQAPVVALRR